MSNLLEKKNRNIQLTGLRTKNPNEENFAQKLRKTAKNLDWIPNKAKKATALASKSNKMQLEPSPEELDILSVKEGNGQVLIEFRARNTSASSVSGTASPSISVQSMSRTSGEPQSDQLVHDGFTAIKVEDEVDIKMEDEMEFCTLNSTVQSIPGTDDGDNNNQTIRDHFAEIKKEDEIEFGEPSISVQSIPTNDDDDFTETEDETECGEEVEIDELNTQGTTVADKPNGSEGNKQQSELICDICSKVFRTKGSLKAHRQRHGKANFNCTVCGAAKFTQQEFDRHSRTHDTNPIYFTCDLCPKKYSSKTNMAAHRKTHGPNAIFFTCEICLKKYPKERSMIKHRDRHGKPNLKCNVCGVAKFTSHELNRHMRVHDTNPIYFTCDLCPKKYLSNAYMVAHRKTHGPNPIFFTCEICSKKFPTEVIMIKHRDRHGKPNFNCNVCGTAKFTKLELDRHMRTHDTNRIYFTCDLCPNKYSSKAYLVLHMKAHDDTNSMHLTCDICSKKFSTEEGMMNHRRRHRRGNAKFKCNVCDMVKFTQHEFDRHMRTHETNPEYFTCEICSKKYSSKDYLFKHMKTHDTNSIHLTCEICSKVFSTKKSMTNHRNRHGKPNFNCNICGVKRFSQFDLNRHIKGTHDAKKKGISEGASKASSRNKFEFE